MSRYIIWKTIRKITWDLSKIIGKIIAFYIHFPIQYSIIENVTHTQYILIQKPKKRTKPSNRNNIKAPDPR